MISGAGGISGLLARTDHSLLYTQPLAAHAYYHCDGNGDVTALINTNQVIAAKYLYDPFGVTLSKSGPLADANLYRFSSKEYHPNSGFVYYLYRFYDPALQRWLNRDPLGVQIPQRSLLRINMVELAYFPNLYWPFGNDPVSHCDPHGEIATFWVVVTGVAIGLILYLEWRRVTDPVVDDPHEEDPKPQPVEPPVKDRDHKRVPPDTPEPPNRLPPSRSTPIRPMPFRGGPSRGGRGAVEDPSKWVEHLASVYSTCNFGYA